MKHSPFSKSDIIESLEAMIRNSDHELMDDGGVGGDGPILCLRLRDGSRWSISVAQSEPGRDYDDQCDEEE